MFLSFCSKNTFGGELRSIDWGVGYSSFIGSRGFDGSGSANSFLKDVAFLKIVSSHGNEIIGFSKKSNSSDLDSSNFKLRSPSLSFKSGLNFS